MRRISLEPEALEVCRQSSVPPLIFQRSPEEGRKMLEQIQSTPVYMYPAVIKKMTADTGRWGRIPVYIVLPEELPSSAEVSFWRSTGKIPVFKNSSYIIR